MKLKELYESGLRFHSPIEVRSGYNGKILCRKFDPKKHSELGERELLSMWADIKKPSNSPGMEAYPMLCCYVDGGPEYEREKGTEKDGN